MATTTPKTTKPKTATVPTPDTTAALDLSDDAALSTGDKLIAEVAPAEPPHGHELLQPPHNLPRRDRAQLMRMLKQVMAQLPALERAGVAMSGLDAGADLDLGDQDVVDGTVVAIGAAADVIELIADVEDALVLAAVDAAAFRSWSTAAADDDVLSLFTWYANSVGEAQASRS